jgi:hypothetical protein
MIGKIGAPVFPATNTEPFATLIMLEQNVEPWVCYLERGAIQCVTIACTPWQLAPPKSGRRLSQRLSAGRQPAVLASEKRSFRCRLHASRNRALAFADDDRRTTAAGFGPTHQLPRGKFGKVDPHVPDRHSDAIEFPNGNYVLVTQLRRASAPPFCNCRSRIPSARPPRTAADTPAPASTWSSTRSRWDKVESPSRARVLIET